MLPSETVPLFQNDFTSSQRIIHTPSVFARTALFYLQETGTLSAQKPHICARDNLDSYLFFIVKRGRGWMQYEQINAAGERRGKVYPLETGDCVFLDCSRGYRMCTSNRKDADGRFDELWTLEWTHFNSASMPSVYAKYCERGGKPVFHPAPERLADYTATLEKVFAVAASESYIRDMELNTQLSRLLEYLMEDAWSLSSPVLMADRALSPKRMTVADVKRYIDTHYAEPLSLETVAKHFYVSKGYLARIFKERYGTTVNSYILYVRIARAKELLRFSDKSVEQITMLCGFQDSSYFARCFRKVEGIAPGQYRRNW